MSKPEEEKHYKFVLICFAITGLSFLATSILGGFKALNIVLASVLF